MDKKDKIVEILESWEKDNGHYFNSILESDYENIADEVVKLFAMPDVRLSFLEEVRKKWGQSDIVEFDKWLCDQLNQA